MGLETGGAQTDEETEVDRSNSFRVLGKESESIYWELNEGPELKAKAPEVSLGSLVAHLNLSLPLKLNLQTHERGLNVDQATICNH